MTNRPRNLSHVETEAVAALKKRLQKRVKDHFVKIILFGSRARGEGDTHSDLDLLVLLRREDHPTRKKIYNMAAEISFDYGIDISPFVISMRRFGKLKEIQRGIALGIAREGREV